MEKAGLTQTGLVEWLRQNGWSVEYNPCSHNTVIELSIPLNGGVLAGHPDGLQNVLADIKTINNMALTICTRILTLL